jgi:transcriptional regulator with XRE-family HTH domain
MLIFMKFYQRIRDLREDMDLTQKELAGKLQMHKTTYTNYEQGKHTVPLDFALRLAEFYHVSIDYIAGRTNTKQMGQYCGLSPEEMTLVRNYRKLSERNKGKAELFLEQLTRQR